MFDEKDYGPNPYVINMEELTLANPNFRTTKWSGDHIQLTVMSVPPGGDLGLEVHEHNDQFIRIEQGTGRVQMGKTKDDLTLVDEEVGADWTVIVPHGTWHNITNVGDDDMKLYTVYGPKDHVPGTVHHTRADAEADPNED